MKSSRSAVAVGFDAVQGRLGGGDLLRPGTGLQRGVGGLGSGEFGAAQGELFLLFGVVQPGHQLAGLDAVALGDEAFDDAARHLEAELGIGHLDVAREHQRHRRRSHRGRSRRPAASGGQAGGGDEAGALTRRAASAGRSDGRCFSQEARCWS